MAEVVGSAFNEVPVICDDQGWIWLFLQQALRQSGAHFVKIPSSNGLRQSWSRLKNAPRIVIHWETKGRSAGALIEEIKEINPQYDIANHIIVVMAVPLRDDIVHLSELGIKRILRIRHKEEEFRRATEELHHHLRQPFSRDAQEVGWLKLQRALDFLPLAERDVRLERLHGLAQKLEKDSKPTAKMLDLEASLAWSKGETNKAEKLWREAIASNPKFFRAYQKLSDFYRQQGQFTKALEVLHRAQQLNRANISRLASIGEVHLAMDDDHKAEHFFKRALSEDQFCSAALTGLAELRFKTGDLEESRQLLAKSPLAYRFASKLNAMGIEMVKLQNYREALEHYTRAQYVLPSKDKGPLLFYNVGLCYYRWGKMDMAREFLKIALVKEPAYKKASELLARVEKSWDANAPAA